MADNTSKEKSPQEILQQEWYVSWAIIFIPVIFGMMALFNFGSDGTKQVKMSASSSSSGASVGGGGGLNTMDINGIHFPLIMPESKNKLQLIGGGVRAKYGLANIYSAGIYVEKFNGINNIKKLLKDDENVTNDGSTIIPNDTFYHAVINKAKYNKGISLEFHRDVDSKKVEQSLNDALSTRLSKKSMKKFLDTLHKVLPPIGEKVKKNMKFHFLCTKGGSTMTFLSSYAGEKTPFILKDKGACPALFDVYLGEKAVSPKSIKSGFGSSAMQLL